jgi:hypothetical protein
MARIKLTPAQYGCIDPGPEADEDYARAREQVDYLEGVLWADPARRKNGDSNPDDIDRFGNHTPAFWRGFVEIGGCISLNNNGAERKYPRVELKGAYNILLKFLAFLNEEINAKKGVDWHWDERDRYKTMAVGGFLRITGKKAQEVVCALYPPESVIGWESTRALVDEIVTWIPRN